MSPSPGQKTPSRVLPRICFEEWDNPQGGDASRSVTTNKKYRSSYVQQAVVTRCLFYSSKQPVEGTTTQNSLHDELVLFYMRVLFPLSSRHICFVPLFWHICFGTCESSVFGVDMYSTQFTPPPNSLHIAFFSVHAIGNARGSAVRGFFRAGGGGTLVCIVKDGLDHLPATT